MFLLSILCVFIVYFMYDFIIIIEIIDQSFSTFSLKRNRLPQFRLFTKSMGLARKLSWGHSHFGRNNSPENASIVAANGRLGGPRLHTEMVYLSADGSHLTMHRTNGLSDYRTIRMYYQAQGLSIVPQ